MFKKIMIVFFISISASANTIAEDFVFVETNILTKEGYGFEFERRVRIELVPYVESVPGNIIYHVSRKKDVVTIREVWTSREVFKENRESVFLSEFL